MEHKHCDTCKFWWLPSASNRSRGEFDGSCQNPKLRYLGDEDGEPETGQDELGCMDGDEYSAWLSVGPKFGCVHHEDRSNSVRVALIALPSFEVVTEIWLDGKFEDYSDGVNVREDMLLGKLPDDVSRPPHRLVLLAIFKKGRHDQPLYVKQTEHFRQDNARTALKFILGVFE